MLCKLLYDVVPEKFHRPVIFSYGGRHMPREHKRSTGCVCNGIIYLNLRSMAFYGRHQYASQIAGIWREMLRVGFHEFGHVATERKWKGVTQKEYENCHNTHRRIERDAEKEAEAWILKILSCNGRLYQPDFLGVVDIIRRRHEQPLREVPRGSYFADRLQSYRCQITGGQLSLSDVAVNLHIKSYEKKLQIYGFIHKIADDLARVHVDSAGRSHHFWVWGDLPIIAQRLESSSKFERLRKEEEEYRENLKQQHVLLDMYDQRSGRQEGRGRPIQSPSL